MKSKITLWSTLLLLFAGTLVSAQLNDVSSFIQDFNDNSDKCRVVVLGDASCGLCKPKTDAMYQELTTNLQGSDDIQLMFVWTRVLAGGIESIAQGAANKYSDARAHHFWDATGNFTDAYKSVLEFHSSYAYTAWKVYLIYEKGVTWDGETPPSPTYFMHSQNYNSTPFLPYENYWDETTFIQKMNEYEAASGVGSEDFVNWESRLFPNPSTGEIQLTFPASTEYDQVEIEVFDLIGKQVHSSTVSTQVPASLKLSHLADGNYIVRSKAGNTILGSHSLILKK